MTDVVAEQAASWQAAQGRDDMDWPAFTLWLEADPRHREVFDELALLEDRIDRRLAETSLGTPSIDPIVPSDRSRGGSFWRRAAGAAAAMAAAVAGVVTLTPRDASPPADDVWRAAGATRTIDLGDGILATLAAGSTLKATPDRGRLSFTGRGWFEIRHEPRRTMTLEASGYRIDDIGTRFEVVTAPGMVRIGVAEGSLRVSAPSDRREAIVSAGAVATGLADGSMAVAPIRIVELGSWRSGPLVYDDVPIGIVAADVGRVTGRTIAIEPSVAARRFSGVIALSKPNDAEASLRALIATSDRRPGGAPRLPDGADR